MTRMSPIPNRKPEWFIEWKETATLDFDVRSKPSRDLSPEKGSKEKNISLEGALLKNVSGHVFDHGQPGTTFSSDQAYAKKDPLAGDILVLKGNVRVKSGDSSGSGRTKGILECDQLQYNTRSGTFRATGNVQFKGDTATLGTLREAVASRDLRIIATPDLYPSR
jgi:lipopolysaccharide assembly outer membrane protein LptD (OstA)